MFVEIGALIQKSIGKIRAQKKIAMCHGTFDIVHPGHIRHLIYAKEKADILITANKSRKNPYFNMIHKVDQRIEKLLPTSKNFTTRQNAPTVYDMNASIYIWKRESFYQNNKVLTDDTILFVMPEERSIDIDSELDFEIVEFLMRKKEVKL